MSNNNVPTIPNLDNFNPKSHHVSSDQREIVAGKEATVAEGSWTGFCGENSATPTTEELVRQTAILSRILGRASDPNPAPIEIVHAGRDADSWTPFCASGTAKANDAGSWAPFCGSGTAKPTAKPQ